MLLRQARELRDLGASADQARHKSVWEQIFALEFHRIREQVELLGVAKTGSRWVRPEDVDDVVAAVCMRVHNMSAEYDSTEPGAFRAATWQAIQWAGADYVRRDQKAKEREQLVDPSPGGDSDSPSASEFDRLGQEDPAFGDEREDFKELLAAIAGLSERDKRVVELRMTNHSAKEIAQELDLSPANVDQIFHRAMTKLRGMTDDD